MQEIQDKTLKNIVISSAKKGAFQTIGWWSFHNFIQHRDILRIDILAIFYNNVYPTYNMSIAKIIKDNLYDAYNGKVLIRIELNNGTKCYEIIPVDRYGLAEIWNCQMCEEYNQKGDIWIDFFNKTIPFYTDDNDTHIIQDKIKIMHTNHTYYPPLELILSNTISISRDEIDTFDFMQYEKFTY